MLALSVALSPRVSAVSIHALMDLYAEWISTAVGYWHSVLWHLFIFRNFTVIGFMMGGFDNIFYYWCYRICKTALPLCERVRLLLWRCDMWTFRFFLSFFLNLLFSLISFFFFSLFSWRIYCLCDWEFRQLAPKSWQGVHSSVYLALRFVVDQLLRRDFLSLFN